MGHSTLLKYPIGEGGRFGISNSSGFYTYYPSLYSAMLAASEGDTIEAFSDYIENGTVSILLKNNVNIDLNGHTYSINNNEIGFYDTLPIECSIMNGTIAKGTDFGSELIFFLSGGSTIHTDCIFKNNEFGDAFITLDNNSLIIGGKYNTYSNYGYYPIDLNNGSGIINAIITTWSGSGKAIVLDNGSYLKNTTIRLYHGSNGDTRALIGDNGSIVDGCSFEFLSFPTQVVDGAAMYLTNESVAVGCSVNINYLIIDFAGERSFIKLDSGSMAIGCSVAGFLSNSGGYYSKCYSFDVLNDSKIINCSSSVVDNSIRTNIPLRIQIEDSFAINSSFLSKHSGIEASNGKIISCNVNNTLNYDNEYGIKAILSNDSTRDLFISNCTISGKRAIDLEITAGTRSLTLLNSMCESTTISGNGDHVIGISGLTGPIPTITSSVLRANNSSFSNGIYSDQSRSVNYVKNSFVDCDLELTSPATITQNATGTQDNFGNIKI